jgi:hypothetical protein
MVNNPNVFMPTSVAPSTYIATSSTPVVTLQKNFPTCDNARYQIPLDSTWLAGSGTSGDAESSLIVMAPDGSEWDLFKVTKPGQAPKTSSGVTCPATSNWAATVVAHDTAGWTGNGIGYSYRASGTLGGSGVIRVADTMSTPVGGSYNHAIALAFPNTRNAYVAPATSSDGTHTDASSVPMGSRIQLDPAFAVETSGLPEWQKQICRTLQKYGMIVVDTGSSLMSDGLGSVRYQGYAWPWEPSWAALPPSVISHFRVLR